MLKQEQLVQYLVLYLVKAFKTISKVFPGADKQKKLQVVEVIQGKTKKQLGVTDKEFRALQKIAGDKSF